MGGSMLLVNVTYIGSAVVQPHDAEPLVSPGILVELGRQAVGAALALESRLGHQLLAEELYQLALWEHTHTQGKILLHWSTKN